MNDWFYIVGFVLLAYCAYSSNPIKFIILKNIRNICFLSFFGLLIFIFSIGGGNSLNDINTWYEKYYDFYDSLFLKEGIEEWIFWTAWISIPVSYFCVRLAMVRDVVLALLAEKLPDSKEMHSIHLSMVVASVVCVSCFLSAFESFAKLITYFSLSYEKIRFIGYFSKPEVNIVYVIVGLVSFIIFKIFFNKALLLNSKYV